MKDKKTIQNLVDEQVNDKKHFLVPSYQRGYRWQQVNVTDLLNDLSDFIDDNNEENTIYSLQPLVVYCPDDKTYHVVDGQQRLTTISILLHYLEEQEITIKYESRKDQKNIFIEIDQCNNIDQYHISRAYLTIDKWFNNDEDKKNSFRDLLTDKLPNKKVCFIWYCTEDNEVATFIRLNKNKISLTNAELVKAMLLKKGNFVGDSILMQKSIAVEWNEVENTFNDDVFWHFIRPIEDHRETRIDFLFEIIKSKNLLLFTSKEETGNDQYSTFRYFYSYFKENKESAFAKIWEQVKMLYNVFMSWFNEIEIYHYIGFLIIDNPKCISDLLDKWNKDCKTITDFKVHLKEKISTIISRSGCNNLSKQYKYGTNEGTDKTKCRPILLLFNIQRIILLNRNMNKISENPIFNKFPFYLYKLEAWNVEHIASNTDNGLKQLADRKEWLKTYLFDKSISDSNKELIKNYINDIIEDVKFDEIYNNLEKEQSESLTKEEHLNDEEKNQIWNFCLLDEHTNKSYGNSIFPVKRRIIMGKELGKKYILDNELEEKTEPNEVAYVPICTKDAFIKAYSANDTSLREWSRTDAKAYKKEMYDCLKTEFNIQF